jgi:hypothetical protein
MNGDLEKLLKQRRSLEQALADLVAEYQRKPRPELARMIELLRAEIELRKQRDAPWKLPPQGVIFGPTNSIA